MANQHPPPPDPRILEHLVTWFCVLGVLVSIVLVVLTLSKYTMVAYNNLKEVICQ